MATPTSTTTTSYAICSVSGLAFYWHEYQMQGLAKPLQFSRHPLFQEANFLACEQALLKKQWDTLPKIVAASLILYRLTTWKVFAPKQPSPAILHEWGKQLAQELTHAQLHRYYCMTLDNFNPKRGARTLQFHFSLEGAEQDTRQLLFLISKLTEEQELVRTEKQVAEEATRLRIEELRKQESSSVQASDIQARELESVSKDYLTQRACSAMDFIYRNIDWETKAGTLHQLRAWKSNWRKVRKAVENNEISSYAAEYQEKCLHFLEWGAKTVSLSGKPGKYLKLYVAWIRAEHLIEDWDDDNLVGTEEEEI